MKNFSVSQLNLFLQCPHAWYCNYLLKIRTPKKDNLFYGSALHFGLEAYNRGNDPVKAVEGYIRTDPKHERLSTFDVEKNVQDGKEFMELYKKKGPYFEPDMIEERRTIDLINPITQQALPVPFTFKIDLTTQNHFIVDYKSTTGNGLKQDELNRTQGISYYSAYRSLYGRPPNGFIQVSLVKQKVKKIVPLTLTYSLDDEVWFWKLAEKVLDMIARQEYFTALPMIKTFYPCAYKDICPIHGGI